MRLEEELQVSSFRTPRQKLSINLMYTSNLLRTEMQNVFKAFGVTHQQYNVLRILKGSHPQPCTIQLLRDRMMDKQSDISRLIDRLQAKGLVSRHCNAKDRRKMDVFIAVKGVKLLDEMNDSVDRFDNFFHNLNGEEVETLNLLMDKIRQ